MKRCIYLLVIVLLAALPALANPQVTTPKQNPCLAGVEFVAAHSQEYPPDWTIVVFCNRAEYEKNERVWHPDRNIGAFTALGAKRTFILYDRQKEGLYTHAIWLLEHELEHIRCNCILEEAPHH